jgi:cell division protein FtsI/penicillin-binding protein 2
MRVNMNHRTQWRAYQDKLKREALLARYKKKLFLAGWLVCGVVLMTLAGIWLSSRIQPTVTAAPTVEQQPQPPEPEDLSHQKVATILSPDNGNGIKLDEEVVLEDGGVRYTVKTTINPKLQSYIDRMLNRSKTLQAAVVVINPHDGRVLAMSSHDKNGNGANLCLKAEYPAASLFKIVSAAAALEAAGYTPEKKLYFNGSRHTLYKNQLKERRGRYTNETKLRKAFAASNNSVFGKLGIHVLGQQVMADYANKFYFNRPIPFDIPVEMSATEVPEDEYGLAEIASGFNKVTRLSPLHAALLSCTVVNNGEMVVPRVIDTVRDESQAVVYRSHFRTLGVSISTKTANGLKMMMEDTVTYGTGRKTFRKLRRRKMFKNFDLGAKTGTINDVTDQFKFDWVTAFALAPGGTDGICVGVLAVHGEKLGTRATEMARAIIDYNFRS